MTKEKFVVYEEIRESGLTNMFAVNAVVQFSFGELTRENCLDIMKNYSEYKEKFLRKGI